MGERVRKPKEYSQTGVANTCRSFGEYMDMFSLAEKDLRAGPVLDVAGGASSFIARLHEMGIAAVAADPFYAGVTEEVLDSARKEVGHSSAKLAAAADVYDWSYYGSPEQHRKLREASMELFAADFARDGASARYVAASLPNLPFRDGTFRLALCSHFLFLYADQFDESFHYEALREMVRVLAPGGEARAYPLVSLKWEPCPFLTRLAERLQEFADVSVLPTKLPFIPVESAVLRLVKNG